LEVFAQTKSPDQSIRDSLFRIRPHESLTQQAEIYLELADLIKEDQPQKSFTFLLAAFKLSVIEKSDKVKAQARMNMGDYFARKRKFIHAQEHYLAACKTYHAIPDTTGEVNALMRIGELNRSISNNEQSLIYLQRGLKLALSTKDNLLKGIITDQIAFTYLALGEQENARYYFNKALSYVRRTSFREKEFRVQISIGSIYLSDEKWAEALAFYNNLMLTADTTDYGLMGVLYTHIGHVFDKMHDHRASLKYNLKALAARQQCRQKYGVNSALINVAGDYLNLGLIDSGKYYMDSGLLLAYRYDQKSLIENGYRHLYTYYLENKQFKRALDFYTRYTAVREEINREKNRSNIAILETNQHLLRIQQSGKIIARKHDIQALNLKYHNYQTLILKFLTGLAGFIILVFITLLLYTRRVRKKMQEMNVQLNEEIRDRKATEEQTRDRENQYKFITDNSDDFITHLDQNKNRIYASPASLKVYGYTQEEIIKKTPYDLTIPEDHAYAEIVFREMLETRSSRQFIYRARKKDGSVFWVESILNPLFDPISGVFKGMVGVTRDIQERKIKEIEIMEGTKQKENLLKEIHHRVKNNFAILVSLINMQMGQTKNEELLQSLTNLQLRIRSMALVHEMLYRSNDFEKISFPGYLRSLASVIAGTYNRRNVDLAIEADEVVMDIETSIPMGLIINEILSNAYKHAFPGERSGKISIRFSIDQQSGMNTLVLQDDGVGMPHGVPVEQYKSMGLQVVQILCAQIEATLVVVNDPGASFTITFLPESN
jgi:PAS domain S-box-containing protein